MPRVVPAPKDFMAAGPGREQGLLNLSEWINQELRKEFETNQAGGRGHLASILIGKVESIADTLNRWGFTFGRIDYGGDVNYEDSYQTFSSGERMGTGIILEFRGFDCKASWTENVDA
jgi:hypothetical protein